MVEEKVGVKMADWKTILIIILILYGWYWYSNPEKGRDYIDQGIDKVKNMIGTNTTCTQQYDPVCGNSTTFNNLCLAQKAGMMNVTMGVCS